MGWMNQIGGLLNQYGGNQTNPAQPPQSIDDDFDQVAQHAPPQALAGGLAQAFRSDQTPPFGNMVSQMFGQSNGVQRADIVNTLIGALGPTVVAQMLMRNMGGSGGLGGAGGILGGLPALLNGGQTQVTPAQAEQLPTQFIEEAATQAQQKDPSIIDQVSGFYAQQPALVKTLGGAALAIALAKLAQGDNR